MVKNFYYGKNIFGPNKKNLVQKNIWVNKIAGSKDIGDVDIIPGTIGRGRRRMRGGREREREREGGGMKPKKIKRKQKKKK